MSALKIIIIFPCIIWFDGHYNYMRYYHLKHDNIQATNVWMPVCLPQTLLSTGETTLNKSLALRNSQSKGRRSKKTLVLIKNFDRKGPICYASVTETRFPDVEDPQPPLYPRPKENCGLSCSAFLLRSTLGRFCICLIMDFCASESREWVERDWKGVRKKGAIIFYKINSLPTPL